MAGDAAVHLRTARSRLESACGQLIAGTAEAVEQCEPFLADAIEKVEETCRNWRDQAPDSAEIAELRSLRGQVQVAQQLIRNGMNYHARWNQLLAAMVGGYTAEGDPPPLCVRGSISLAG